MSQTSEPSPRAHGSMTRPPWWIVAVAASFAGYFALLVYSDTTRPEPTGFSYVIDDSRTVVSDVAPASPAGRAGLQPGDRVVRAHLRRGVEARVAGTVRFDRLVCRESSPPSWFILTALFALAQPVPALAQFAAAANYAAGSFPIFVTTGDLNLDGKPGIRSGP